MNIILIYFAVKYEGDWNKIYQALEKKEKVSLIDLKKTEESVDNKNVITILDIDYPKQLKSAYMCCFTKIEYKNILK